MTAPEEVPPPLHPGPTTVRRASIRTRLLLFSMGALVLLSGLMLWELRTSARTAANEAYDRLLLGSALAIAERVIIVDGDLEIDLPYVALEMLSSAAQDRVFYQVSLENGQFVTGYQDLPQPPIKPRRLGEQPFFYDVLYRGEQVRIGMISRYVSSPQLSARFTVMVGETTQARNALIEEMMTGAILRQLSLIIMAGLTLWIGVSWGLKPLSRLQEALSRRSPKDLRPIEHRVPNEVQHLVEAINDLMKRLSLSIEAMRRFTSNAAHQLRTPLAAIQTQTELALKTDNPADLEQRLHFLEQSTRQSTRLVNQLLSLAKATPGETDLAFEAMDLVSLCQDLTRQLVPKAIAKDLDLGLETNLESLSMMGHQGLLDEAIRNLVENAILYCPAGSRITVHLHQQDDEAVIEVEDNGPGIPDDMSKKIFERFNRAGRNDGDGCGLGLPIVKEIVAQHGGTVKFQKGLTVGTTFRVVLPL